jgi:site-specific recombinase XerD
MVYFGSDAARSIRAYLKDRRVGYLFQDKIEPQKGYITYYKKAWIGHWKDYRNAQPGGVKRSKWLGHQSIDLTRRKPDRPLNRSALGFVVKELGRRSGVGKIGPHTLRHSFATHLLQRGADIRAIQELLGHSYLTSTQIYTRISNNRVRATFHRFHPRG